MKSVSFVVAAAALLSAGNLSAADEGGVRVEVKPAGSPVLKAGEGGKGFSITINPDGQVSGQGLPGGVFSLGEARTEKGPWLGITTEPVSEALRAQLSLARSEGLLVGQVVPGSPAATAGLTQNDILLRLDDQILVELSQLKKLIAMKKTGDQVKLVFLRKAARQEAIATLTEHEIESSEHSPAQWLQAIAGLSTQAEAGGHELSESLQQMLKQLLGSALGATAEKGNPPTAPALGALLNPDLWKRVPSAGNLENLRKQLESSSLPAETKELIRKSIDQAKEAADKARAALDEAAKAAGSAPK